MCIVYIFLQYTQMNATMNNNDFEINTNKWKQIFTDFIELIVEDNDGIFETYGFNFKLLTEYSVNFLKGISKLFINRHIENILYSNFDENEEYSVIFLEIVYKYFNEYQFVETPTEEIKQYLKFLCVVSGTGDYLYPDINEDPYFMDIDDKTKYYKSLICLTSLEFLKLHQEFIEYIFMNILTPSATYLK